MEAILCLCLFPFDNRSAVGRLMWMKKSVFSEYFSPILCHRFIIARYFMFAELVSWRLRN
jgi:hypothetical protein